jgi:hypothetical protein
VGKMDKKTKESEKPEFESVTVKVPKNIMNLLRAYSKQGLEMTVEEYLECSVLQSVKADLDAGDVFTVEAEQIIRLYDLNPTLSILR